MDAFYACPDQRRAPKTRRSSSDDDDNLSDDAAALHSLTSHLSDLPSRLAAHSESHDVSSNASRDWNSVQRIFAAKSDAPREDHVCSHFSLASAHRPFDPGHNYADWSPACCVKRGILVRRWRWSLDDQLKVSWLPLSSCSSHQTSDQTQFFCPPSVNRWQSQ